MFAIVIMSFGTIFTAHIEETDKTEEMFDSVVNKFGEEEAEMAETVEVSAPYLVKSVRFIIKSFGSVIDVFKEGISILGDATDMVDDARDVKEDINDLDTDINSAEDAQKTADGLNELESSASALENSVSNIEQKTNEAENSINKLADSLKSEGMFISLATLILFYIQAFATSPILGVAYLVLTFLTVALPIVTTVCFIVALISLLVNLKDPGKAHSTISKAFGGVFVMLPTLMLFKIIAPQVKFGSGLNTIIILCVVTLVLNLIASRLKRYSSAQFKYLNLLQAVSVVSIVGYFIFLFNINGMHLFAHIWEHIGYINTAVDIAITVIVVFAFISLLFTTCKFIKKTSLRLCCMVHTGKVLARDTYLVSTIFSVGLIIAPIYLMFSPLELDFANDMISFVLFSVGIILMLVCEIVLIVLKNTLCADATSEDIHAVLTGCPEATKNDSEEATPAKCVEVSEEPVILNEDSDGISSVDTADTTEAPNSEETVKIEINSED